MESLVAAKIAGGAFGIAVLMIMGCADEDDADLVGTIGLCASLLAITDGSPSARGNCKPCCDCSGYGFSGVTNAGCCSSRKCSLQVGVEGLLSWSLPGLERLAGVYGCSTSAFPGLSIESLTGDCD